MESETDPEAGVPEPPGTQAGDADSTPFALIEPPAPAFDAAHGTQAAAFAPPQYPQYPQFSQYPQNLQNPQNPQYPPGVQGYPPYGYGYPNPQARRGTNGTAVAAFIVGICGFLFITSIVGLILGIVSLGEIRKRGQRGKAMAITGIVLSSVWIAVFAGLIAIAAVIAPDGAQRNGAGDVVKAGSVGIYDLRPKDCFTVPAGLIGSTDSHVRTMPVVPCSTPHDSETIGSYSSTDSSYPGDDAMRVEAGSQCLKLLSGYLLDVQSMPHGSLVQPVVPNAQAWGEGERKVVCFVQFPSATVTKLLHRDASSYTAEQLRYLNAFRPVSDAASRLNVLSLSKSTPSLSDLRQRSSDIAAALQGEIAALTSAPWPANVQPHIDALVTMERESAQWWTKAADAPDATTFKDDAAQGDLDTSSTDVDAVRKALGLSRVAAGGAAAT